MAYVPLPRAFATWKRYRGGRTTPIWIASLATSRIEKVQRDNSNDFNPMWAAGKVWFLSDRNGPVTLYSYDPKTKRVAEAVPNKGLDLKSASTGPDAIVYEQFGSIHLYDLKSGKTTRVPISVTGDFPEVRERLVRVGQRLGIAHLSPTAARALFETRGEIITVPAEKGDARNLTNTTGVMERDPAWSPDGRFIAYFSDESGDYMLHITNQNGTGAPIKIKLGDKPDWYFSPRWSPDSKKVADTDSHQTLWYVDINDKRPVRVDKDPYWFVGAIASAWAPDSKWLTYSRRLPNRMGAVFAYSLSDEKATQVTDGLSDARNPVFDKDGKYLYFTASTDVGASLEADIGAFSRPTSRSIYMIVLDKTLPSPFAPESDEEKPVEEKPAPPTPPTSTTESAAPNPEAPRPETPRPTPGPAAPRAVTVKIDFDNILQRVLSVPMPPRRYTNLQVGRAGVLLAIEAPSPGAGVPVAPGNTVYRFDLSQRRSDVAIAGVTFFEIAQNGEKMLYRQGDRWFINQLRVVLLHRRLPQALPAPPHF
jgi:tricorn protease